MITVIVPIYNAEKYLEECLESIINQSYSDLEIILVNDGSSDSSRQICEKYKNMDERIILINKENEGLVKARKLGITKAHGEYITFVDADDWIDKNAYEVLITENADIIAYGLIEEYDNYSIVKRNEIEASFYGRNQIESNILPTLLCTDNFFEFGILPNLVCKLIRKDILFNTMEGVSDNVTIGEDVDFFYRTVFVAKSICVKSDVPYHYRQHEESMMKKNISTAALKSLFSDLSKVKNTDGLKKGWDNQVDRYILFVTLLKRFDLFIDEVSELNNPNSNLVIYGAGGFGKEVYRRLLNRQKSRIVYLVDKKYKEIENGEYNIESPENIIRIKPAVIFIAVLNLKVCYAIKEELENKGVDAKCIFIHNYFECLEKRLKEVLV